MVVMSDGELVELVLACGVTSACASVRLCVCSPICVCAFSYRFCASVLLCSVPCSVPLESISRGGFAVCRFLRVSLAKCLGSYS